MTRGSPPGLEGRLRKALFLVLVSEGTDCISVPVILQQMELFWEGWNLGEGE